MSSTRQKPNQTKNRRSFGLKRQTKKKQIVHGTGGWRENRLKRGLLIAIPVLALSFGGFLTIRSFAAQSEAQRFATEMYQRCYNQMKTSGSGYDFWVGYINQHGNTKAWTAFVAEVNKSAPNACSHPYPPVATQSQPAAQSSGPRATQPVASKRTPVVTDFQKEARNRVEVSNAFVANSGKELAKARTHANKSIVEQKDLVIIQNIASSLAGWLQMNQNFQNDIMVYMSQETDGTKDAWLKSMYDVIKKNHSTINANLMAVMEAYAKGVENNKNALALFTYSSTPTGVVGQDQVGSPSACSISGGVHRSILQSVNDMCAAAARDGVYLSGSGWRDTSRQIELRRAHCGPSDYAIYQMPASSCRPPTAIPGSSRHERGLAIDFSNCSHGSACFRWLSGNAKNYGLYNLPSESWHWSTDGR